MDPARLGNPEPPLVPALTIHDAALGSSALLGAAPGLVPVDPVRLGKPSKPPGSSAASRPLHEALILEICAGSAVLSKACRKAGMHSLPVDITKLRASGIKILTLDLTQPGQLRSLLHLLRREARRILLLWVAPPYGAASRARARRLPALEKHGFRIPRPLRDAARPDAVDGLQGSDKVQVEVANILYEHITCLVLEALDLSVPVAIENPSNSWYWETSAFAPLLQRSEAVWVSFHNCCHGGKRPKATSLWTTWLPLLSLQATCDNSHEHLPWTPHNRRGLHFPSHDEASYPALLCFRLASLLREHALATGFHEVNVLRDHLAVQPPLAARVALGALPRGAKARPLVAEFGSSVWFAVPLGDFQEAAFLLRFPKGARITSRLVFHGGTEQAEKFVESHPHLVKEPGVDCVTSSFEALRLGIPSDPKKFVQRAVAAGHPKDLARLVDEVADAVIEENFVGSPFELASKRVKTLKRWIERAKEPKERDLHRSLPQHLKRILKGKRLLLWQEINDELGFPDVDLVNDVKRGFPLSGWLPQGNMFEPKVRVPDFDTTTLKEMAKGLNEATLAKMVRRQDPEMERATWKETEDELSREWIWEDCGPLRDDVSLAMRFGIRQGPKIRVIDDASCGGLNCTVGLVESFQVHSIDRFAALDFNVPWSHTQLHGKGV